MSTVSSTIGIDLGGTKIEGILLVRGKIVKTLRVPTEPERGYQHMLRSMCTLIETLRQSHSTAVGIAVPGRTLDGKWLWKAKKIVNKPLAQDIRKSCKLPTLIENDAKCFAYAEAAAARTQRSLPLVGIIVGTGVGSAVVTETGLFRGAYGSAGELGEAPYGTATFEDAIRGQAWSEKYREFGGKKEDADARYILSAQRDLAAKRARDSCYEALAKLCATALCAYNPRTIVFGGGVSQSLDITRVRAETAAYAPASLLSSCAFKRYTISDSAGAVGAALLAHQNK